MSLFSFKGGIHPPASKTATEAKVVVIANPPQKVIIPMRQHIGAACEPLVKKGDLVKKGQLIGEPLSFVSAAVHSSVSGKVTAVGKMPVIGGECECVVIENDFAEELDESVKPIGTLESLTAKEILKAIENAGIVGMGGAGFPMHVKLSPPPEKTIDTLILNGAECEPYLTADHRLMLEKPEAIVDGARLIMKALAVEKAFIGIEDNKPDAIASLEAVLKNDSKISVVRLHTKYPQGAEKQLIYACVKKQVPSGGLPMDVGVVVSNVASAATVADAILRGMPSLERICTISGCAVKEPKNLLIKVGTPLGEIIDQCGGYQTEVGKIIIGGPMMGMAQASTELPATKTTSGILVFAKEQSQLPAMEQCIKCGKCINICPAFLQPVYISEYALKNDMEKAAEYGALDCIECGSCSFICPAKRPLLDSIRMAKREIIAQRRKAR